MVSNLITKQLSILATSVAMVIATFGVFTAPVAQAQQLPPLTKLEASITPDKNPAFVGDTVKYNISIKANGALAAFTNFKGMSHDRRASIVGSDLPGFTRGTEDGRQFLMWNNITIPANGTVNFSITVDLKDIPAGSTYLQSFWVFDAKDGYLRVIAQQDVWNSVINVVAKPTPSPSPTPTPSPSPSPSPTPEVKKDAGLRVEKTDERTITRPGHSLTYTIKVKNTKDADLHDVVVEDKVPGQLTVTGASSGAKISGNTVRWEGIALESGQSKNFSITVKVKDNTPNNHVLHNIVTAESKDHDVKDEATDDTTVIREQVKGIVQVIEKPVPVAVPVTAKTGAGLASFASVILGAAGLYTSKRLF